MINNDYQGESKRMTKPTTSTKNQEQLHTVRTEPKFRSVEASIDCYEQQTLYEELYGKNKQLIVIEPCSSLHEEAEESNSANQTQDPEIIYSASNFRQNSNPIVQNGQESTEQEASQQAI